MNWKHLFLALLFVSFGSINAQNTLYQNQQDRFYRSGLELLDQEKFSAAREQFENYLSTTNDQIKRGDAEYYIAFCALNLDNADGAQLITQFVKKRPYHPKAAKAYYNLGVINFKNKDYQNALKYLTQVEPSVLSEAERIETDFKIGYSYYARKNMAQAARYFDRSKRAQSPYYADANYYSGYIAYQEESYDKALIDLKRAGETKKYQDQVPALIASVYFKEQRFTELLGFAEEIKEAEQSRRRIRDIQQIYLLTGEALYSESEWKQSAEYFIRYMQIAKRNIAPETMYKTAYAQFKDGQTDLAIANFKRVALGRGELAQHSSYYLGQLYVDQENYLFAITAFDKARKLTFNKEIQEEAAFNYAKVNFQTDKYSQAIAALDDFIEKFPSSNYVSEANNLLSEAFLNTNDYSKAISFIEKIENKSPRIKEAYQKVTFFRGTEFYNAARYFNAVQMFNKSLEYPEDRDLATSAHFWKGEAFATAKAYPQAIESYLAVFSTRNTGSEYYLKANYGIGYSYYNSKDYRNARIYFKRYVDRLERASEKLNYNDAILRLADCYYVDKAYASAINYYQRAIDNNNPDTDYAYFQKGVVRDFQDKNQEAIAALDEVINRFHQSRYYDDAIYKKAQIQLEAGDYRASLRGFTTIIDRLPQSPFIPYAHESRGLAHFNLKQYEAAEADYKTILDKYITSRVANSALLGLQNTLTLQNKTLEFDQYLSKYKSANPDNQALESIEFESAKNLYFSEKYNEAISAFSDYIRSYPESGLRFESKFYIAESYYRQNEDEKALEFYHEVYRDGQLSGMDRVFERIGTLELQAGKFNEAANFYRKLEDASRNERQQGEAWSGLLEAYFRLADYSQMRGYSNKIISNSGVSPNAVNKAQLYLGKAAYAEGDFNAAIDEFLTTLNTAKDQYGAEAQYMVGVIFYQQKKYRQSLNTLFEIQENFSVYDEWLGKAFIMVSRNYIALEEYFQAKASLNSIIENSPVESVVAEAREILDTVEKLEAVREQIAAEQDTTGNNNK